MLTKTYLLTGSRNPGFKLWKSATRATHHGKAFWRSRERSGSASPYQATKERGQRNKLNRQFKRRHQPC